MDDRIRAFFNDEGVRQVDLDYYFKSQNSDPARNKRLSVLKLNIGLSPLRKRREGT